MVLAQDTTVWEAFGVVAAVASPLLGFVLALLFSAVNHARKDAAVARFVAESRAYRWAQEDSAALLLDLARYLAVVATDPAATELVSRGHRLVNALALRRHGENGGGDKASAE